MQLQLKGRAMPHAEMIRRRAVKPRVRRSVSLELDHASNEKSQSFILTACARRAIQRVVDGISSPSSPRAWTLTGPFGTGKSSFCLFLFRLLAPATFAGAASARALLEDVDPGVASAVASEVGRKGFTPVVITGARESFSAALSRGLVSALAESSGPGAKRIANEIREYAGDARRDPMKMLDRAVECLTASPDSLGVLIIVDELGKLLEYAAANPTRSDVYILQRIAERASRSVKPILFLGVLHQDFAGYATELSETDRKEWEKVRGRFEDIIFEQSADDMLRLIAEAMPLRTHGRQQLSLTAEKQKLCQAAWVTDIAPPGLDSVQGIPLLRACLPLHPCVTLLLGPIFKRFGQNERSAFSFIMSAEPHALTDFEGSAGPDELYSITHLYAYLVGIFGDALLAGKDGKRWAEAFNVESQHPELTLGELSLLRTIALLGIVGRWNGIAASPRVLEFALSPAMTPSEIDSGIRSLLAKSAIVFRRFNSTYSLWEGSDIDIEARIADARSRIAADASAVQLLRAHFAPRPLVARRHSYETGTLRYFDVVFSTPTALDATIAAFDQDAKGLQADGKIVVVLPDPRIRQVNPSEPSIQALSARPDTILCVPGNAAEVESRARELFAVHAVREATVELQNDATARRELATRDEEVRRQLEQSLSEVLAPKRSNSPRTRWYRRGEEQEIPSARALNELLSTVSDDLFPSAPNIQNEIINRRELSSSAAAARRNLIRHMLLHGKVNGLEIEGNPPERSIYLSVLRGLKLHHEHHGEWIFASTERGVRKDAQPLYRAIKAFFDSADAAPKGLDTLFNLLRRPPFGLRNGVIPIFICAALLGNEADVAVYEDGGFVPQLTEALFEKFIKDPSRYAIRRWHVSGVRVTVFEQLAKMLGQTPAIEHLEARDILDVVKPLMRFVRKLNNFARNTRSFSRTTVRIREAIANASEPDALLFRDLPEASELQPFAASRKDRAKDVNSFLRTLQSSLNELQRGYDLLLKSLTDDLAEALDASPTKSSTRAQLAKRAAHIAKVALNADIKVFTTRLAESTGDDSVWIEQISAFLASKHPSDWHDDDRGRFNIRLEQMANAFKALEGLVVAREESQADADIESIRISVVGTRSAQTDMVVHLTAEEGERAHDFESRIAKAIASHARNGSRKLVLAALARVAQSLLTTDASQSQHDKKVSQ